MQTDDQLTRELGETFRATTAGLKYSRPVPTPRHVPVGPAVVAAAAAVVAVGGLAYVVAPGTDGQSHSAIQDRATNSPSVTQDSSSAAPV